MNTSPLSPQQLGQLIPLVPTLIAWLRSADRKPGDLFLQDGTPKTTEVQQTLRELLNAMNYHGDLTMVQLRYICRSHDSSIWASAIRLIMTHSEPRLISEEIGNSLIGSLSQLDGAQNAVDCCRILGPTVDQLPRSHFNALGEFCALLRDTSDDAASLACLVGPLLLTPGVAQGRRLPQHQTAAAAAVMDLLIEEAEPIFGRVAAKSRADAFGIRKPAGESSSSSSNGRRYAKKAPPPQPPRGVTPPPGLGPRSTDRKPSTLNLAGNTDSGRMAKRKQQLRAFYQWRDPSRADKVDMLLENHNFHDVAKAIQRKYGMLPPGWRGDLVELQQEQGVKFDWFVQANAKAQKDAKGRPISYVPPPQPAETSAPTKPTSEDEKNMDMVINEIADTEQTYHDKLSDLLESYVKELRVICTGQRGKQAQEALGLTLAQVDQIFGWRLDEIINVSNNLLTKLEVVTLVRTEPKTGEGRPGLVAEAFIEIAPELHVYAPYVSSHNSSMQELTRSLKRMEKQKSGASILRSNNHLNFVKLWEKHSAPNPRLKGQSLQSLLILPVQRVPRYKLLLEDLQKKMPKGHRSEALVGQAVELIRSAAGQINEELRKHEKLKNFFGDDHMPNPVMSKAQNGGRKGLAIRNQYVSEV